MSERVLYEWRFAGYVCRIVETEPGIVHFEQAQESTIPLAPGHHLAFNRTEKPLGCANEIIHLSQALAEANVINRDQPKWMPSDAWVEEVRSKCGPVAAAALHLGHLRTAIHIAVEKALAEQREARALDVDLAKMCAERLAEELRVLRLMIQSDKAQRRREVIEARIEELRRQACVCEDEEGENPFECYRCKRLDTLRAELAALDKEVTP